MKARAFVLWVLIAGCGDDSGDGGPTHPDPTGGSAGASGESGSGGAADGGAAANGGAAADGGTAADGGAPQPPDSLVVNIVAPDANAVVNGIVEVQAETMNADGAASISLEVDGTEAFEATDAPAVFAWRTCGTADGEHTLTARAMDDSGAVATDELELVLANAEVAPELSGEALADTNRLEWQQCGAFDEYRVFWGTEPGVGEDDEFLTTTARRLDHRPTDGATTHYYRVAAVVGQDIGELSNEIELTTPPTKRLCSVDGWCWDHGPPQGADLDSVVSFSDDDVIASATGATIHWNGDEWQRQLTTYANLTGGLWGAAPDDVWRASQALEHWDGTSWTLVAELSPLSIWGLSATSIWAYGRDGVFHFDGQMWSPIESRVLDAYHPYDIWASGDDDIWVVGWAVQGGRGILRHYDGMSWGEAWTDFEQRTAVWGSGPDDVWSVGEFGEILHWEGTSWDSTPSGTTETLNDIHGCAADDVWAVGNFGKVVHFDGDAWSDRSPPTRMDWKGVWCNDAGTVWIVGERGEMLRFDGQWSPPAAERIGPLRSVAITRDGPIVTGEYETLLQRGTLGWRRLQGTVAEQYPNITIRDMHGTGPDDIWAVGEFGTIIHWDGMAWTVFESVVSQNLTAVWALGEDDVWASGDEGVMVHFDGQRWDPHSAGHMPWVDDLWGAAANDVWVVGWDGIMHFDGNAWTDAPIVGLPQGETVRSIWGASADDIWATSSHDTILHFDGDEWSSFDPGVPVTSFLNGVHGSGPDDIWITATDYTLYFDGNGWTRSATSFELPYKVIAIAPGVAWGADIPPQRWNGQTWTRLPAVPTVRDQFGLWALDSDHVYEFGDVATLFRFTGQTWESELPVPANPQHLGDTWVEAPESVWLVGDYGTIRHWDGDVWRDHESGTLAQLFAIAGVAGDDIWAAGEAGTMLHYDGVRWEPVESGTDVDILDLWAAASNNVVAVGGTITLGTTAGISDGTVVRWNGMSWSEESAPNVQGLGGVWGSGPDDIWAVGDTGACIHWTGSAWTEVTMPSRFYALLSVWGLDASSVWAVGENGFIYHYNGDTWQRESTPGVSTLLAVGGTAEVVWAVGDNGTIWRHNL